MATEAPGAVPAATAATAVTEVVAVARAEAADLTRLIHPSPGSFGLWGAVRGSQALRRRHIRMLMIRALAQYTVPRQLDSASAGVQDQVRAGRRGEHFRRDRAHRLGALGGRRGDRGMAASLAGERHRARPIHYGPLRPGAKERGPRGQVARRSTKRPESARS